MKQNLIEDTSIFLLKKGFTIKNIRSCFDILARKNNQILLIKLLHDANSISPEDINEMKKISLYLNASPLIITETAGTKLQDNVVYSRSGIFTINLTTFENSINNQHPFIKSGKSGLTAEVIGKKLKEKREDRNLSLKTLATKLGVSRRMIVKYENNDSEISFQRSLKLHEIFGSSVFKQIDILVSEITDHFYENFSEISRKYHELGFGAVEIKKLPFNIIAKKENEIVLTKVGDKINEDLITIARLLDINNLVIFQKQRPKIELPAITKQKFLEFEDAEDLIDFLYDFA